MGSNRLGSAARGIRACGTASSGLHGSLDAKNLRINDTISEPHACMAWYSHIYIYTYIYIYIYIYTYISWIRCLGAVSVGMRRTDTCLRIAYRSERARAFLEVCAELHGRWGVLRMARVGMGSQTQSATCAIHWFTRKNAMLLKNPSRTRSISRLAPTGAQSGLASARNRPACGRRH